MKNVVGEFDVPILIAKKLFQFTTSLIVSFIAPSELLVLKVDLFEFTPLKCCENAQDDYGLH